MSACCWHLSLRFHVTSCRVHHPVRYCSYLPSGDSGRFNRSVPSRCQHRLQPVSVSFSSAVSRHTADNTKVDPATGVGTMPTPRQRLKTAVLEYGSTVFVFHIALALCSLGVWYTAITCGLDIPSVLRYVGVSDQWLESRPALISGGSFVVAYAVHKLTAPGRIAITLSCAPLIVRALRRRGILKTRNKTK